MLVCIKYTAGALKKLFLFCQLRTNSRQRGCEKTIPDKNRAVCFSSLLDDITNGTALQGKASLLVDTLDWIVLVDFSRHKMFVPRAKYENIFTKSKLQT